MMSVMRTVCLALLMSWASAAKAQVKTQFDRVIFMNGQLKEGKITEIGSTEVKFQFRNETLVYSFRKADIHRIEFASGRVETITEKATPESIALKKQAAENKVAVLPMPFIGDRNSTSLEEMKFRLQEMAIEYFQKQAHELVFLEPSVINSILRKNNISEERIKDYNPTELAEILGVEYLIIGNVTQLNGNTTTLTNNSSTAERKIKGGGNGLEVKEKNNGSSFSNTSENIQTDVAISIFNDKGEKIFSRSRHSLLSTPEAYKNALYFLLKKTPVYRR